MLHIAAGISEFTTHRKQLPTKLAEAVQDGYLSERPPIYQCPLLHNSLKDEPVLYTECEFEIRFEPNEVVISLPRSIIDRFGLSAASAHLVECHLDKAGHMISP
jgi:hypothetical protein